MKTKQADSSITSMTGYGRATGESPAGRITVEIRSLNHRYLEVAIRAPKTIMYLDPEIRALVKARVSRGKVEVFIAMEERQDSVAVNLNRAQEMAKALQGIAESLGDKVRLEHLLAAGEIVVGSETEMTSEAVDIALGTVANALDSMVRHRRTEGQSLAKDLIERMEELGSIVETVEVLAPQVPDRVRQQVNQFLSGVNLTDRVDPQRLEVEVALLAQRSDIAEEITRLKTHLSAFDKAVSMGGVTGRRLDFLLQEIQREVNTMGSKSGHTEISRLVVDFKTGLEKVREQVQNIE